MSGHSKWSTIKHAKGAADAKRGQIFTKLTREIIVSVRQAGSNPESNYRLRLAIQKARDNSMPLDNIERAIKRGSGDTDGAVLTEISFEGYGPSGAGIMVQTLTDNRNRTVQDIRNVFSRHGGNLGENGCVAWLFDSRGIITIESDNLDTEELALKAIDAGAEDVNVEGAYVEIYTKPDKLETVRTALEQGKIPIASAGVSMVPKTMIQLDEKAALQTLKLLQKLEELDEVQNVSSNVDFSDAILKKYQEQA
ncbi:MAG: YebC/PmpR family DNA-binding transcriptional regulator [Dehalococcoidales bacterium]|nr:YebC/PmpR family DNA-binding transcriptional regulator [Dehalococcoidales bacterium]